jgi:hypothetical protein
MLQKKAFCTLVLVMVTTIGCSVEETHRFATTIEYESKNAHKSRRQADAVQLFPIIGRNDDRHLDPGGEMQLQFFREETHRLTVHLPTAFEHKFVSRHGADSLRSFYGVLAEGDERKIRLSKGAWKMVPARYAVVIRLRGGARIRTFDRHLERRLDLTGELWDLDHVAMLWQAETSGIESDTTVSDRDFLYSGLAELYNHLPLLHRKRSMQAW